jgi:5-hydroxyisourate hydrolase
MSRITTHVLDTARGRPAAGVPVRLDGPGGLLAEAVTDHDGRVGDIGPERVEPGTYTLTFDVAAYDEHSFFPQVALTFRVTNDEHHHVPLLLAPFTYSTYRGS